MTIMSRHRLYADTESQMKLIEHFGLRTILEARISALAYRSGEYSRNKHRIVFDYYNGVAIEATPEELINRAQVSISTNGWQESLHLDTEAWLAEGRVPIIPIPRWLVINSCEDLYFQSWAYRKAFDDLPDPAPTTACARMWDEEMPWFMRAFPKDQPANGSQPPSVTS